MRTLKNLTLGAAAILGLVLGVVTGLITLWVKKDLALAFLYGLQPTILGCAVEILIQVITTREQLSQDLHGFSAVHASTKLGPLVTRIVEHCRDDTITRIPSLLLQRKVIEKLEGLVTEFEEAAHGRIAFDISAWITIDRELLSSANSEVLATSPLSATSFWQTPQGRNYWLVNKQKVQQGIKCTRIFIASEEVCRDPNAFGQLAAIMKEQQQSGVAVYVAEKQRLPHGVGQDFVVFDGNVCSYTRLAREDEVAGIDVRWSQAEVSAACTEFSYIREHALSLDEFLGQRGP